MQSDRWLGPGPIDADLLAEYRGTNVLVTGGAGAIGSNLTRVLAEAVGPRGRVLVLDSLTSSVRWNVPDHPSVTFVEGDILDESMLKRVFRERPSVVFHLAAFFANQNSVDHPERDLMVNGLGTLRLMELASMCRVERFVFASSGCSVYPQDAPLPVREGVTTIEMKTPYQVTKMLGELYGNYFHHQFDLPVVRARLFNSFGPGELPGPYRNVIPNFIYWALLGRPLPITGTGDETRDFTWVGDLVDGLLRAGVGPEAVGEAFNLAAGGEVRIADLAHAINDITGNESGTRHTPRRRWDTKRRQSADASKARELLGFRPRMHFHEGLERTVRWFRSHWGAIVEAASFAPGALPAVPEIEDARVPITAPAVPDLALGAAHVAHRALMSSAGLVAMEDS